MMDRLGVVRVADFGLAKIIDVESFSLTMSNMAVGTPHYLAPEALLYGTRVDCRADLYSLGVMTYQMLTGSLPIGAYADPCELVPELDPRVDVLVTKAMSEDPEDRHQTVLEFWHDVDEILSGQRTGNRLVLLS